MGVVKRRRDVLLGTGVVALGSLTGCLFGSGSGDGGSGGTYDVVVNNDITKEDLSASELDESTQTTLTVEVDRVQGGSNEVLFERTLKLDPGSTRTFRDAVQTEQGDATYAVNVELDPGSEIAGGIGEKREGLSFTPGGEAAPSDGSIDVRILDEERGAFLKTEINVEGEPPGPSSRVL